MAHPSLADITGTHMAHLQVGPWVPLASGMIAGITSMFIPEDVMPYVVKLVLAMPLGLLTGLGSGVAAWIIKRILVKKAV